MPNLVCWLYRNGFAGSKLKNRNSFLKPNFETLPKIRRDRQVRRVNLWFQGESPLFNFTKILWAGVLQGLVLKGAYPGVEAPVTPDELDANVVPAVPWGRWLGVGLSSASGCLVVSGNQDLAMEAMN
jgi:hypothetical protein